MRTVPFIQPLSRKITSADIEALPLSQAHIRVMKLFLEQYDQDSMEGLSISRGKLAALMGVSQSTVARALREASAKGFLIIFDTYIKGVGQSESRYIILESILTRALAPIIQALPPRVSTLRGVEFQYARPTLLVDRETGKVTGEFYPKPQLRWPPAEMPARRECKTIDDIISALEYAQYRQEGVIYLQHAKEEFERKFAESGLSFEELNKRFQFIMNDEGLLAVTSLTSYGLKRPLEMLRQDAALLKKLGRQKWGEMLLDQIPKDYYNRVPLLAAM